jgi:hypothetical protein
MKAKDRACNRTKRRKCRKRQNVERSRKEGIQKEPGIKKDKMKGPER